MALSMLLSAILCSLALIPSDVNAQSCNTDQNPYCRGNSQLEALCCPYPSVCYWSNRDGEPACCPAGQDCRLNGGPGPSQYSTPNQQSYIVQTLSTQSPTTYTLYSSQEPQPTQQYTAVSTAVVIITQTTGQWQSATTGPGGVYGTASSAVGGAYTTVTSFAGGAFTTVTSAVGGAFSTVSSALVGQGATSAKEVSSGFLLTVLISMIGIFGGAVLF